MRRTLCLIGLERHLSQKISFEYKGAILIHDMLPKYILSPKNDLYIERSNGVGFLKVDIVVYHGIFENDFDFLTALSFWNGPCFPNPLGMLNCRLKLPCLSRALRVTNFGAQRGMIPAGETINSKEAIVAKWGNWHCGENKAQVIGKWSSAETSVLEPYFSGNAVRIVIIGDDYLQIQMDGDDWLKSIHHNKARLMEVDQELLDDSFKLKKAFNLEMIANDYISMDAENKYLLEVNHIPNMTRFDELQTIYLKNVCNWLDYQIL